MSETVAVPAITHSTKVRAHPDVVYDLLSSGTGWDRWFTDGSRFEPQVGSPVHLCWKGWTDDGADLIDEGVVLEVEPGRRFSFTWRQPPSVVTFTIDPHPDGAWLQVEETGLPQSAEGMDRFAECSTGWGEALTLVRCYAEHGFRLST